MEIKKRTKAKEQKRTYTLEQYLNILFRHKKSDEKITLFFIDKQDETKKFNLYYKSIDEAIEDIEKYKGFNNIFVSLGLTNGNSRKAEDITSRSILAFDFDKKDLGQNFSYKDIINIFKKQGIYYHMLVDSGNGYHAYVLTENADNEEDLKKLLELNSTLAQKLNADVNAVKPTQVLRVPTTLNYKDKNKPKRCNLMFISDNDKQIEYNLDNMYNKNVFKEENTNIKYLKKDIIPPCIVNILNGVEQGQRHFCLGRLTKYFQLHNYSKEATWQIVLEWNTKCKPQQSNIEALEEDFNSFWQGDYKLMGCVCKDKAIQEIINNYCDKYNCKKKDKYEIVYLVKPIHYEYKILSKIKPVYRGGRKYMLSGNAIAIISVLKNRGMINTNQLIEELTSTITKKCCMSRPTMINALKELEEMKVIEIIKSSNKNNPDNYRLLDIRCLDSEKATISYHATQRYIDGAIGQVAFRLYCYMLYNITRGINVVQEQMAIDLGVTQQAISKAITELEKARFLNIIVDYSINPLGANVYEWLV